MHPNSYTNPIVNLRDEQRLSSRHALRAAAIELVGGRGFSAVTVDDIARSAGVSRRTFFNHFPTKMAALFDPEPGDADRLEKLLAEADVSQGIWPGLQRVCLSYIAGLDDVLALWRALIAESPELAQYQHAAYLHVEVAIEAWVRRLRPDECFASTVISRTATGILSAAFAAWQPSDDLSRLYLLVAEGFSQISTGFSSLHTHPSHAAG